MENLRKVKISSIREIAPGSFILSVKRDKDFIPGQVVALNLGNEQPARLYSIASSSGDPELSILFNIKEDGFLTPKLAECRPGDAVDISDPFGSFTCADEEAWFIASGTGIAPFASMILSGQGKGKTLIHGSRFASHLYFRDEIKSVLKERYIPCCSGEAAEGAFHGRLTQYLKECGSLPKGIKYYLCGSAEMVVETRDILIAAGIAYSDLVAEIYF